MRFFRLFTKKNKGNKVNDKEGKPVKSNNITPPPLKDLDPKNDFRNETLQQNTPCEKKSLHTNINTNDSKIKGAENPQSVVDALHRVSAEGVSCREESISSSKKYFPVEDCVENLPVDGFASGGFNNENYIGMRGCTSSFTLSDEDTESNVCFLESDIGRVLTGSNVTEDFSTNHDRGLQYFPGPLSSADMDTKSSNGSSERENYRKSTKETSRGIVAGHFSMDSDKIADYNTQDCGQQYCKSYYSTSTEFDTKTSINENNKEKWLKKRERFKLTTPIESKDTLFTIKKSMDKDSTLDTIDTSLNYSFRTQSKSSFIKNVSWHSDILGRSGSYRGTWHTVTSNEDDVTDGNRSNGFASLAVPSFDENGTMFHRNRGKHEKAESRDDKNVFSKSGTATETTLTLTDCTDKSATRTLSNPDSIETSPWCLNFPFDAGGSQRDLVDDSHFHEFEDKFPQCEDKFPQCEDKFSQFEDKFPQYEDNQTLSNHEIITDSYSFNNSTMPTFSTDLSDCRSVDQRMEHKYYLARWVVNQTKDILREDSEYQIRKSSSVKTNLYLKSWLDKEQDSIGYDSTLMSASETADF